LSHVPSPFCFLGYFSDRVLCFFSLAGFGLQSSYHASHVAEYPDSLEANIEVLRDEET
jgi:hypothetical protein